jgi:hypothetical protein
MLIARLAHREGRNETREALAALGAPALAALKGALYDRNTEPAVRLHIPRAIARFESTQAAELLVNMLSEDLPGALRYKALRGLGRLAQRGLYSPPADRILPVVEQNLIEYARLDLAVRLLGQRDAPLPLSGRLFLGLLRDKKRQALERATRLLQLLHPREDLRRVYYALLSDDIASRVAASEILEVTSLGYGERLRSLLRLSAEPRPDQAPLDSYVGALEIELPSETELLRDLMGEEDLLVSALAASYAMELDHPELAEAIRVATANNAWLLENTDHAGVR